LSKRKALDGVVPKINRIEMPVYIDLSGVVPEISFILSFILMLIFLINEILVLSCTRF